MEILTILLLTFGGVFMFAGYLLLVMQYEEKEGGGGLSWADFFLFGGALTFIRAMGKAIDDTFHKRFEPYFTWLVLFSLGLAMVIAGFILR